MSRHPRPFGFPARPVRHLTAERAAAAREFAAAGLSQKETAARLGMQKSGLSALAKRCGIKFRHDRLGFGVDHQRVAQMAALYRSGKTLRQIGDTYGVTCERVRQIIRKHGVRVEEGGQARLLRDRRERIACDWAGGS